MSIGHPTDEDQFDAVVLVRVLRRRGWLTSSLAMSVVLEWAIPFEAVHTVAHVTTALLAVVAGMDLVLAGLKRAWRWIRRKIVIIDLTPDGRPPWGE